MGLPEPRYRVPSLRKAFTGTKGMLQPDRVAQESGDISVFTQLHQNCKRIKLRSSSRGFCDSSSLCFVSLADPAKICEFSALLPPNFTSLRPSTSRPFHHRQDESISSTTVESGLEGSGESREVVKMATVSPPKPWERAVPGGGANIGLSFSDPFSSFL